MIGEYVVFNNPFAGGAKAASAQSIQFRGAIIARQKIRHSFAKNKASCCKT
jgi:hypothetical protein